MARRNIWRSNTTHHKPKLLEIASRRAFRSSEKTDPCCVRSSEKTNRCFGKSSEKTGPCCIRSSEKTDRCFSISSEKILVDTKYPTNVEVTNSSGPPTSAKDNSSNFFLKLSQVFCTRSASLSLSAGSCSARTCAANCKDKRVEIHMANNFFLDLLDLLHFQTDGFRTLFCVRKLLQIFSLDKTKIPFGCQTSWTQSHRTAFVNWTAKTIQSTLQAKPRDQKRHSLLPMWILVAPPDQQHLHITNCCGNVSDELRTFLKQVTHMSPQLALTCTIQNLKKRTRCWNGDKISSSKKVNASVSGKLSWVCMICRRQPKRFLRQLRLGTLFWLRASNSHRWAC